ncbi:MAG: ATP-binding protein [Humidesulfovibrio sp.]
MAKKIPFSQDDMNVIFKISPAAPERVVSRESGTIEFKESFGWASLAHYLKTSGAYANAKGGYIVFGIANSPHRLCGLAGGGLKSFREIDPEKLSGHFNEHFAPEIEWEIHEYEFQGKTFGLLYIHEAKDKPVLCTKDAGKDKDLKEGDIYYRYRGRSQRIRYPELKSILEAKRENEQRLWMRHIANIARIGVREVGIFDLHTGCVTGAGSSFLIEESLLSQLAFIKEGEFSEVKGKPALKLIGTVEALSGATLGGSGKHLPKGKGIRTSDIVLEALNQENEIEPEEFIKQICYESTAFLPMYYFMKKARLDLAKTVEMLGGVPSRSPTRKKLVDRLNNRKTQKRAIPSGGSAATLAKQKYAEALRKNEVGATFEGGDFEYCLQAIRGLSVEEVKAHSAYLRGLLRGWFNMHYASANAVLADNMRRAICWVDEALNMGDC